MNDSSVPDLLMPSMGNRYITQLLKYTMTSVMIEVRIELGLLYP